MDRPYVQDLWIKNYGGAQDTHLTLSPLHALIGPNDSGKTTILRAIQTLELPLEERRIDDEPSIRAFIRSQQRAEVRLGMKTSDGVAFEFQSGDQHDESIYWSANHPSTGNKVERQQKYLRNLLPVRPFDEITAVLRNCTLLRLDPDALRAPQTLLPEGSLLRFVDDRGLGLPAVYDAIQNRDIDAFLTLNGDVTKLFPDVKSIRLVNDSPGTKAIGVQLKNGTFIPAEAMSEGLLYYLAFAALRYIDPPAILLIEEPENGLHPARIAEVMRVLRELSKTTQIILATHSPLVINELEPHEVSIITRTRETGTQAKLIKDTANFEERSKVYALGELWLSYANGIDEAPLISGGPRP